MLISPPVATRVLLSLLAASALINGQPTTAAASGSGSNVDWSALSSELSTPVQITDVSLWLDQCVKPFDAASLNPLYWSLGGVSNYDLFEQSSGLCMQTTSCAFTHCAGIFKTYFPFNPFAAYYQSSESEMYSAMYGPGTYPVLTDEEIAQAAATSEDSQLPAAVVHPEHPGDISAAVRFAAANGLKVAVKTSGHNWNGSSTRKGSLLLNLSKLRKFALPETPSEGIVVCDIGNDAVFSASTVASSSILDACKLAVARGKPAVMRAGGGQIVDEGLRALEEWNNDFSNIPLHGMTGSAGTVSLAGGWLASGGLGGSLGMRMYGIGVDQVLHVEMVLPDGRFVRFGPSAWTPAEDNQLYPQTTEVKGYCISDENGLDLSDETNWEWVDCSDEYNFEDLWFAIRGGSGGSWGVVTSVYYQLHHKPGNLQEVYWNDQIISILLDQNISDENKGIMISELLRFVFAFLYKPESVGVSAKVSNSCSAPDAGPLVCYNGAGEIFVKTYDGYFDGKMPAIRIGESPSYASSNTATSYNGRVTDVPRGNIVFTQINPIVVPIEVIQNKFDEFMDDFYTPCYISGVVGVLTGSMEDACAPVPPYFYGGGVQQASDGMDAYPPHRRNGAFHSYIFQEDKREQLKRLIWDVQEETETFAADEFPGLFCHNHLFYSTAPKKSNWLVDCNGITPDGSGTPLSDDDCMSIQEASFGTANLRRLEKIHSEIDPLQIFQTSDGPGYASSSGGGGEDSSSATGFFVVGPVLLFLTMLPALVFM
eukprot:CAMPEP_0197725434 /NCGR_PEP_ID=MMETSP1434-20131217/6975_1 /TAXON_ID=265543 /ORGANISM="Minutocellus polymorphus, Strain CCMP3303" /LENGTH=765 /DNA_ID=CAMNT_0043310909 /DNA_START=67 /DNA_END=2364 /DNA_ORIENTATION=+